MSTNPIVRFAVERRVTMSMAALGILVLGWLSLIRLPLEFLPAFSSSSIWVRAPYESSSPEEIERTIVRPLEDILGTIDGIDRLTATASSTQGSVNVSFLDGTDMDLAAVEVRDRVDRVRHLLPDDLRRIEIRRFQSTDVPVLRFQLSADWDKDRFYHFVENVMKQRLERLEGVAQVDVRGLKKRELQVRLDAARMLAHDLDVRDIGAILRTNNVNVSGGFIKDGSRKLAVRSVGELKTAQEIRALPIPDTKLRLSDIAEVDYDFPRQEEFNFLNRAEAITVNIFKTSSANLLAVVDNVKTEFEEVRKTSRADGLILRYVHDSSVDVRKGLGQLRNAGVLGGALAISFLFLFLRRPRTTLLIAISIPLSVVLTFVVLFLSRQLDLSDVTVNIVSLMGMMLALGMLVDNSIVVIESIFRHHQELREDARTAALKGTSEVAMPIMASTATTMCVFVPLIFLSTMGGGFMRFLTDIGTTICAVMVASLMVALTIVPMIAAYLLRAEAPRRSAVVETLVRVYGHVIGFSLRHRVLFVVVIVAMLYGSFTLLSTIQRTYSPRAMERQVTIYVDTPRHYSLEQTQSLYDEVAGILLDRKDELDVADVIYSYRRGAGRTRGRGGKRFEIFLVEEERATLSTSEVRNRIRELLPVKAGVEFKLDQSMGHGGGRFGLSMELMGDDTAVLELLTGPIVAKLNRLPWVRDLDTSLESGDNEIRVGVDRPRALRAGSSSRAVAMSINSALTTRPVSRLKSDEREVDVVMQFREEDRRSLDRLKKTPVFSGEVALPVAALAHFEVKESPRSVERVDRRPKITITANTVSQAASFVMMDEVSDVMSSVGLPPGYEWSFGRWERRARDEMGDAVFGLVLAVVLIYLIMAALFESFAQPLTIMFSIPFALIGVGLILKLTNQPLDRMTNLGLIILVGVVVNNAIVLIDHINHLRWQGLSRDQAVVLGGKHRLRPILMTALTTILGLAPMVAPLVVPGWLGRPEGRAAHWAPVGLVVLGGLTASTFLTLVIIPTIYSLMDDFSGYWRRVVGAL